MTLFGVSDFALSCQNQWTNFDNVCIILMKNQCSVLYMLQKSQDRRKYPCDSFREAGSYICYLCRHEHESTFASLKCTMNVLVKSTLLMRIYIDCMYSVWCWWSERPHYFFWSNCLFVHTLYIIVNYCLISVLEI